MMLNKVLAVIAAGAAVIAFGALALERAKSRSLERQLAETVTELRSAEADAAACNARLADITEDGRSDAEVDSIPDDDLHVVPDGWLFAPEDSRGSGAP